VTRDGAERADRHTRLDRMRSDHPRGSLLSLNTVVAGLVRGDPAVVSRAPGRHSIAEGEGLYCTAPGWFFLDAVTTSQLAG